MKKNPSREYEKRTGRKGITAVMAIESKLRTQKWLQNGCNGFHLKRPTSNPMSFWTEQDVLQYIKTYSLPIAEVYGEIRYHANIHKALEDAFKDGLVPYNYADRAHRPKESEYIAEYYNRDELLELFDVVKGKKIEFAVLIAAYYGFRREEVVGLKWSCIDFKYKTITVKHTVTECSIDGKFMMVAKDRGKSKKSIRTLPLVAPVEQMLLRLKEKERLNKEIFGDCYNYEYDEYIYKDPDGKIVKPGFITQHFTEQVIKKYNLKKIRYHDLRHSCATLLRHEGVPMEDIQKWLGHSQITITNKLYAHFQYDAHIRSEDKIGKALEM